MKPKTIAGQASGGPAGRFPGTVAVVGAAALAGLVSAGARHETLGARLAVFVPVFAGALLLRLLAAKFMGVRDASRFLDTLPRWMDPRRQPRWLDRVAVFAFLGLFTSLGIHYVLLGDFWAAGAFACANVLVLVSAPMINAAHKLDKSVPAKPPRATVFLRLVARLIDSFVIGVGFLAPDAVVGVRRACERRRSHGRSRRHYRGPCV